MSEWGKSVEDWDIYTVDEYLAWVRDTYGADEVRKLFAHADAFRAVKDVLASVAPQTENNYTDHLAHAMMHTKEVMAANLMKKLWSGDE